jgi:hypothetical protein
VADYPIYYPNDLRGWRDKLFAARMRGVREVRDANGEQVTFSSDREMASAIAAADRELAARPPVHTIRFRTSKG